jgi:hypothetical protein
MIDRSVVEDILKTCLRSPTGDNIQPWRFHINKEGKLEIHYTWIDHLFNHRFFISYIELGVLLGMIKIQSFYRGLDIIEDINLGVHDRKGENPWAVLEFTSIAERETGLLIPQSESFDQRYTDRRNYLNRSVPKDIFDQLTMFGKEREGIHLHILEKENFSKKYLGIMEKVDGEVFRDPETFYDVLKYCHFKKEDKNNKTGMPVETLALGKSDHFLLDQALKYKAVRNFLSRHVFPNIYGKEVSKKIKNSSFILSIEGESNDESSLVEMGRTMGQLLPWLAEQGLTTQPLTVTSLFSWLVKSGRDERKFPRDEYFRGIISELINQTEAVGLLNKRNNPFWNFRVGYPINNDQVRTPRLSLDEILI